MTRPDEPSPDDRGEPRVARRRGSVAARWVAWTISLALLAAIFYTAPLPEIITELRRLDPEWMLFAMALVVGSLWLRGKRWSLLLGPNGKVSAFAAAEVANLGLALNALLPARIGEIARIAAAHRRFGTGIAFTATTVAIERFLDALVLLSLAGIGASALPGLLAADSSAHVLGSAVTTTELRTAFYALLGFSVLLAAALAAVSVAPRVLGHPRLTSWLPAAASRRLTALTEQLRLAIAIFNRPRVTVATSLLTLAMWTTITAAYLAVAQGLPGAELSPAEALVLTVITVAASSLPSVPGAWGIFEAAGLLGIQALRLDWPSSVAVAYLLAAHSCQYLPIVLLAAITSLLPKRNATR